MLAKRHLERYTEVLLWGLRKARKGRYKKGDIVLIRYDLAGLPLAEQVYGRLLELGMHPVARMRSTSAMELAFFEKSTPRQITFLPPGEEELFRNANGSILIYAPDSLTHLSRTDPKKIGKAASVYKRLRDIMQDRESRGDLSWTICVFPTRALARHAGLSMKAYEEQIVRACYLNRRDPVAQWQEVWKRAQRIKAKLNRLSVDRLHIEAKDIDLVITPGQQRRWIGISGRNIPSFEIFLSPDWRGTEGVFYADQPSFRSGNRISGVRLEFRKGRVRNATAEEGEAFLKSQLKMDKGAARVGEFSLTDVRFSKINRFMANTLFDENYGGRFGNSHIALGSSYANTYTGDPDDLTPERKEELGLNDSALHWNLVNTGKKRVTALLTSGRKQIIYENGHFTV